MKSMAVSTISVPGKVGEWIVPTSYINSEYFTIHSGGYVKYGHMVFINLRIGAKKAVPAGSLTVFDNGAFPLPLPDNDGVRVAQVIPAYESNVEKQNNPYITASGSLNFASSHSAMQNNSTVWIGGCYLTDS